MESVKHFFVYRLDRPGTQDLRAQTRPAHLEYASTLGDTLIFAGPTLEDDHETMNGSVWVLAADSIEEAEAITRADPYEKAGLFESKIVQPILKVIPA